MRTWLVKRRGWWSRSATPWKDATRWGTHLGRKLRQRIDKPKSTRRYNRRLFSNTTGDRADPKKGVAKTTEYVFDHILRDVIQNGETKYLVRLYGYSKKDDTLESSTHIPHRFIELYCKLGSTRLQRRPPLQIRICSETKTSSGAFRYTKKRQADAVTLGSYKRHIILPFLAALLYNSCKTLLATRERGKKERDYLDTISHTFGYKFWQSSGAMISWHAKRLEL